MRATRDPVVPEFDMPCHTRSWFAGYPELASGPDPKQSSAIDLTRETTYTLLAGFLGEMSSLFPDAYVHTGGDECDMKEWEGNARIHTFMAAHGIKDGAALQARFTVRVQKIVAGDGKIMMGWDEVLGPDTPKDVVIESWRGPASLAEAARQGNRGVLSSGYYIDLNQSAAEHYLVDPLGENAATLTPEQKTLVLAARLRCGPTSCRTRIWTTASGRVLRRLPSGCGRRKRCAMSIRCTSGFKWCRRGLSTTACVIG